ncbi:TPA: hypothetical protein ACSTL5_000275 [Serratia fonticola]
MLKNNKADKIARVETKNSNVSHSRMIFPSAIYRIVLRKKCPKQLELFRARRSERHVVIFGWHATNFRMGIYNYTAADLNAKKTTTLR